MRGSCGERAANPTDPGVGCGLWGFEGDYVKSAGHIRPLRPTLQEQLRRPYEASLLTGIDRFCGTAEEAVASGPDFYKHQLRPVQCDNIYLPRFAAKVALQHAQPCLFNQCCGPVLVTVAQRSHVLPMRGIRLRSSQCSYWALSAPASNLAAERSRWMLRLGSMVNTPVLPRNSASAPLCRRPNPDCTR